MPYIGALIKVHLQEKIILKKYAYIQAFIQNQMLMDLNDKIVLDIGCGGGSEMDFLFLQTCNSLIGIDVSKEMLKIFHKRVKTICINKPIYLVLASAENLPFRSLSLDYASIFHTLHHCPNYSKVINEM